MFFRNESGSKELKITTLSSRKGEDKLSGKTYVGKCGTPDKTALGVSNEEMNKRLRGAVKEEGRRTTSRVVREERRARRSPERRRGSEGGATGESRH